MVRNRLPHAIGLSGLLIAASAVAGVRIVAQAAAPAPDVPGRESTPRAPSAWSALANRTGGPPRS